jgi:hypothetical protein
MGAGTGVETGTLVSLEDAFLDEANLKEFEAALV